MDVAVGDGVRDVADLVEVDPVGVARLRMKVDSSPAPRWAPDVDARVKFELLHGLEDEINAQLEQVLANRENGRFLGVEPDTSSI